ncbi:hypothetical protein Q9L58_000028 [Maublancomyces gigas]|uniref:glutathione gamma-glutamylcysteinyltransferase n=1 Tax=Discina gigas TaxID=1032678 RepID=A0ABR3GXR1_9PEZI
MRELPKDHLIGYDTVEGKRLFKQALLEGGLEAFFPLSQQFLTQNEPAYCGIGTLCMILNALKVDPAITWRKPWRWFTQEMLDCCQPLEHVKQFGITLAEFACLAKCNGLDATTKFANATMFEEFEEAVKASTISGEQFLAVSYSRASLGQTGAGHFSPVGGYCSENGGMVLVLDVARFKYPSYWVPIKMLFDSLIPVDPTTNQPRGYSVLRQQTTDTTPRSLLRLNATKRTWQSLFDPLWLNTMLANTYKDFMTSLIHALGNYPDPVLSRHDDLALEFPNDPTSPTSPSSAAAVRQTYGTLESVKCKLEYQSRHDAFHEHVERKCELYGIVDVGFAKLEVTIFFLALLGMQSFLRRLQPELQDEIVEMVGKDLRDPWIAREAGAIRRQMESLEGCCTAEGNCSNCHN